MDPRQTPSIHQLHSLAILLQEYSIIKDANMEIILNISPTDEKFIKQFSVKFIEKNWELFSTNKTLDQHYKDINLVIDLLKNKILRINQSGYQNKQKAILIENYLAIINKIKEIQLFLIPFNTPIAQLPNIMDAPINQMVYPWLNDLILKVNHLFHCLYASNEERIAASTALATTLRKIQDTHKLCN